MADEGRNGWKIFSYIVIIVVAAAAIGILAFLIGRGCDGEDNGAKTTTRTQSTVTTPVPQEDYVEPEQTGVPDEDAGGSPGGDGTTTDTTTTGTTTTERYVVGEGGGVTPCIGGFRTVTHTTHYSDGSTDTTSVTEPCTP